MALAPQGRSMKEEFCIMPDNPPIWRNFREYDGLHRHEIFHGPNRQRSIRDGMVIFLPPELHNMSNKGIHFNPEFEELVKELAQVVWMEYYGRGVDDFRMYYGRNYVTSTIPLSVRSYIFDIREVVLS